MVVQGKVGMWAGGLGSRDYGSRLVREGILKDVVDIDRRRKVEALWRCVGGYSRIISEKKMGLGLMIKCGKVGGRSRVR